MKEHEEILGHIVDQNSEAAAAAMRHHLMDVLAYSQQL